jgi:transposase
VEKREMSLDLRARIIQKWKEGISQRKIAEELAVKKSAVNYTIQKFKRTGSVANVPGRGRKPKLNDGIKKMLVREVKKNRQSTSQAGC